MPKLINIVAKTTLWSRLLKKTLWRRPKLLSTFCLWSERWMLAIFGAIDLFLRRANAPRKRFLTGIFPGLKSLDFNLFNAPRIPKPLTGLKRTIKTIGAIKKAIVIMTLMAQGLKTPSQPSELIQPIAWHGIVMTSYLEKRTKTWAKSSVTIIIKKDIFLTNAPSSIRQKTSIGFDNFHVDNWQ